MSAIGRLRTIPGSIPETLGVALADLAGQVPAELAIVDVGADRGRSTCYLAFGARNGAGAHVWGVDSTWTTRGVQLAMLSVRQQGLRDKVTLIGGPAEDAAALWSGPKVAFLHISGDEFDVKTATAAWRRHLADNALLAYEAGAEVVLEAVSAPPKAPEPEPAPEPPEPQPEEPTGVQGAAEAHYESGTVEVLPEQAPPTGPAMRVEAAAKVRREADGLDPLTVARLKVIAKREGVELRKDARKREIVAAIRAKRGTG